LSDRAYVMEKERIVAAIRKADVNADAARRHLHALIKTAYEA
jgi:hypothetical protein